MDDFVSTEELREEVRTHHEKPLNETEFVPDTVSSGDWTVVQQRADHAGVAIELEHPTGERIMASSFALEKVDTGPVDLVFYRKNAGWPVGEQEVELMGPNGETESYTKGYGPFKVAMCGVNTVKDFAEHHGRSLGWLDMEWIDATSARPPTDRTVTDHLDDYFTECTREELIDQFDYYADI